MIPLIVIEDYLPTGFILDEPSLSAQSIHFEITGSKLKIYLENFLGNKTISYRLISTTRGEFVATGALAYSMYNPQDTTASTIPIVLQVK